MCPICVCFPGCDTITQPSLTSTWRSNGTREPETRIPGEDVTGKMQCLTVCFTAATSWHRNQVGGGRRSCKGKRTSASTADLQ